LKKIKKVRGGLGKGSMTNSQVGGEKQGGVLKQYSFTNVHGTEKVGWGKKKL